MMQWMDGHCDVLWRMWQDLEKYRFYDPQSRLDSSYFKLREAPVALQIFAIFVPSLVMRGHRLEHALKQISLFYEEIVQKQKFVLPVTRREHLSKLNPDQIGALLLIEGVEPLQGEIHNLRIFFELGVRQVGLTWNPANEAADGIEEERGGGLTRFGWKLLKKMKELGMILDVSHLSVKGFWEVIEYPIPTLASHSNCYSICPHIRNLHDDQIKALIEKDGLIGITFVPSFVYQSAEEATIDHILKHIEHVCELGGENHLFFGSDFDGIERKVKHLENYSQIHHLKEALLKRYPESLVRKWAWENGYRFYDRYLPE